MISMMRSMVVKTTMVISMRHIGGIDDAVDGGVDGDIDDKVDGPNIMRQLITLVRNKSDRG